MNAAIMRGFDTKKNIFICLKITDENNADKWDMRNYPYIATIYSFDGIWKIRCHQKTSWKKKYIGLGKGADIKYGPLEELVLKGEAEIFFRAGFDPQDYNTMKLKLNKRR